jgi:hypothetical protein
MTDAETAAAIKALTHRINQRDEAIRNGEEYADAEPFSLEFMTAMLGNGWRHREALAKPRPAPAGESRTGSSKSADLLAEARARCAVSPTRVHPAEEGAA